MADTDCLHCTHSSHRSKPCATCGCQRWVRADFMSANVLASWIPYMAQSMVNVVDILCEAFPEAADSLRKKREEAAAKEAAAKEEEEKNAGQPDSPTEQPESEQPSPTNGFGDSGTVLSLVPREATASEDNDSQ